MGTAPATQAATIQQGQAGAQALSSDCHACKASASSTPVPFCKPLKLDFVVLGLCSVCFTTWVASWPVDYAHGCLPSVALLLPFPSTPETWVSQEIFLVFLVPKAESNLPLDLVWPSGLFFDEGENMHNLQTILTWHNNIQLKGFVPISRQETGMFEYAKCT